jgi:hypothetical protein
MYLKAIVRKQGDHNSKAVVFSSRACILIALFVAGCQKSDAPPQQQPAPAADASPAPAPDSPNPAGLPPPPPPNPNVTARAENSVQANVGGQPDEFLTQQLRVFIQEKGRLPQTFAEFARARLDNVPKPPEGTKWVIDSATQQVEAAASK